MHVVGTVLALGQPGAVLEVGQNLVVFDSLVRELPVGKDLPHSDPVRPHVRGGRKLTERHALDCQPFHGKLHLLGLLVELGLSVYRPRQAKVAHFTHESRVNQACIPFEPKRESQAHATRPSTLATSHTCQAPKRR
jgi:hypothetical protein